MSLQPRSAYSTPHHQDSLQVRPSSLVNRVRLRHPGYNDSANILLTLAALDHPEGGIHHETARIACAIIANNEWGGFLTETKSGTPVQADANEVLRGKDYYFRISEQQSDGQSLNNLICHLINDE